MRVFLLYILIRLSAINIVEYLYLSTICFNRGRLTWNSNAITKYTRSRPHRHVIVMILTFKCTDFFTLCQKENCVSLFIFHCGLAWYIVEWWPQHSFDLCNIHGWILMQAFRNIPMCIVHHIYHYKIILLLVTVIYRISTNLVQWKETGVRDTWNYLALR